MNRPHDRFLRLIAVVKFLKCAALIALGVGAFKLLHKDMGEVADHLVDALKIDPGNRFVDHFIARISNLRPDQIKKLGLGSFLYASLFLAEGTGLWLEKLWGEWMTVIITSSLVPVEIYEIYRHPSAMKVALLVINAAIVGYLIWKIRQRKT